MGVIRVRHSARIAQPQGPVSIDRSNPITRGLAFVWVGSAPDRNLIAPNLVATDPTYRGVVGRDSGAVGIGRNFDSTQTNGSAMIFSAGSYPLKIESTSETFLAVVKRGSVRQDEYIAFHGTASPATDESNFGMLSDWATNNIQIGAGRTNVAGYGATEATQLGSGEVGVYVGTLSPGSLSLWKNGKFEQTTTFSETTTQITGSISVGGEAPVGGNGQRRTWGGSIYLVANWNRALSAAEAASVSANPWQLFEPDGFFVPIQTGSSATDTALTPGTSALTLTGYAPTVAQTANVALTPGVVALTLTGFAPTVTQTAGVTLTPGTAALTLTGYAPTVAQTANVSLTPGVLALTLTGYAPTVGQTTGLNLIPATVALTVTGYAPTVAQTTNVFLTPSTLGLSLVGYAPTVTQTGVVVVTKGGAGKGSNLTLKQKKKLKAVVNQEWLKAEQTVQELLLERLGHTEPAKIRVEKLTQSQSLLDVIDALKALSKETVTLPEQQAVIKTINKTITEKTIKQVDRTEELEKRMAAFEKRLVDIEEMVLVALSEIL